MVESTYINKDNRVPFVSDVHFVHLCQVLIEAFSGTTQERVPEFLDDLQKLRVIADNEFQVGCVNAVYHKMITGCKTLYSIFD